MGTTEALAFATEKNLAVMLVTREDDGFKEYTTPAFDQIVVN